MQWDGLTQWLQYRATPLIFAVLATLVYTGMLVLRSAGGGKWENIGKLIVFSLLIVLGFWALREREFGEVKASLSPFFANGATGLFQAMGYTFIAVQGFDLKQENDRAITFMGSCSACRPLPGTLKPIGHTRSLTGDLVLD